MVCTQKSSATRNLQVAAAHFQYVEEPSTIYITCLKRNMGTLAYYISLISLLYGS